LRISTSRITFVNEYAKQIRDYQRGALTGVTPGITEAMCLDLLEAGNTVFNGFVDFNNGYEVVNPTTVKCGIKQLDSIDTFAERAKGLTFGSLVELGVISELDYKLVPYINEKEFNFIEFAFLVYMSFALFYQLRDLIKQLAKQISDLIAHFTGGITGPAAGVILTAILLLIDIAFAAFTLALLLNMIAQIFDYLISPIKYHKAMRLRDLLDFACNHLGFDYNTSIPDIDELTFFPSKFGIIQDEQQFKLFQGITIIQPGEGIPSTNDSGYILWQLLQNLNSAFRAEITVTNGVVEHHARNNAFWDKDSSWQMPSVLEEREVPNLPELKATKVITFEHDRKDTNTLENYKGTTYEVHTAQVSTNDDKKVLLKGYDRIDIPYALANRKNELNAFEKLVRQVFEKIDDFINFVGGNGNNAAKITARVGVLKIETDYVNTAKLIKLNSNDRLNPNHRDVWSAKYLYDNYINEGSFILNNYGNQHYLYKKVRIPFGTKDFNELINNVYFYDCNGDRAELELIEWDVSKDFALLDYRVPTIWTKNLEETYIEQE